MLNSYNNIIIIKNNMNNAFNMIMRTTALMIPQPFIMRQALRPFSMAMMQTQNESFNMMFD